MNDEDFIAYKRLVQELLIEALRDIKRGKKCGEDAGCGCDERGVCYHFCEEQARRFLNSPDTLSVMESVGINLRAIRKNLDAMDDSILTLQPTPRRRTRSELNLT